MPKRVQRKRTKGWRMPPNTVSVTRPGRTMTTYYQRLGDYEFKELPRKPGHKQVQLKDVFRYDIGRDTLVSVYHILECEIIRDFILNGQVVIHPLSE